MQKHTEKPKQTGPHSLPLRLQDHRRWQQNIWIEKYGQQDSATVGGSSIRQSWMETIGLWE